MLDIADDGRKDWMERNGGRIINIEAVVRSRLRIDTRKWTLARINPGKYGDKLDVAHTGQIENNGEHDLAMIARKVAFDFRIMAQSNEPTLIESRRIDDTTEPSSDIDKA